MRWVKKFFFCERCNGGSRAAQPGSSSNRPTDRIFASILINSQRRSAATTAAASSCRRTHTHLIQCTAVSSTSSSPFVVVHWAPTTSVRPTRLGHTHLKPAPGKNPVSRNRNSITLRWRCDDDNEREHKFFIQDVPKSLGRARVRNFVLINSAPRI